MTTVPVNLCKC